VQSPPTKGNGQKTRKKYRCTRDPGMFLLGVVTLIVIGIYAWYARQQTIETSNAANAAMEATKLAKSSAELDQRAWMGIAWISGKSEVGKQLTITVSFKNTGRTPAKKVRIRSVAEGIPKNEFPNFAKEKTVVQESKGIAFPQAEIFATLPLSKYKNLEENTLKAIMNADTIIYVYGILEYDDIFKRHHWITFCYYLRPNESRYGAYKEHNDTDDN
jgi:hypothetical protein